MEQLARRRRRPALSCIECRRRKIKCDRNEPCAHCISAKVRCVYKYYSHDPTLQQRPLQPQPHSSCKFPSSPSGYAPSPSAEPQLVEIAAPTSESRHERSYPLVSVSQKTSNVDSNGTLHEVTQPSSSRTDTAVGDDGPEQDSTPPSSGPMHNLSKAARDTLLLQHGLQDSDVILNKTRTLRWSHWVGAAEEFAPIVSCFAEPIGNAKAAGLQGSEIRALNIQSGDLYRKCKAMAKSFKLGRPSRSLVVSNFELTPPSREMADSMAALYVRSFESAFRVLHIPSFWAEYQDFWSNPESIKTGHRLKILLVIALGSSISEHNDADGIFRRMVQQWIYAAQEWLSGPLEKDRLDITGVQVHCLTLFARQIFSIGGDLVWISIGSLTHTAMQIGLHRDPKHLPKMPTLQMEVRRRLWATILELAIQSSLDSAMPPRISLDEFDTEAPSNNNDDELEGLTSPLQPHPRTTYTSVSFQLLLYDSLPARLRLVQLLNSLRSELSYVDVLGLSSQITEAYQACHAFMKQNEEAGVTAFHRNFIDFLLRRFLIPLHCPYAARARSNPLFSFSLKVSLDTAVTIISPEVDDGFSRLLALGGGMFREGLRYASAIIGLELIAQVEHQRIDGTLRRNIQYIDFLKRTVRDMISLAIERVRQGETNIKNVVFLNMILGQVEAMEAGIPMELKIAQCARDSLQTCHALLSDRAEKTSSTFSHDTMFTPTSLEGEQGDYGFDLDLDFFLSDAGFS